jgi:hypothetical protein
MRKDFDAIGSLALEIFNAHLCKNKNTPSTPVTQLANLFKYCKDETENDFVSCCFSSFSINSIWFHPFINNIYSLKVLSVYSILTYFQESNSQNSNSQSVSLKNNSNNSNLSTKIKTKSKSIISIDEDLLLNTNQLFELNSFNNKSSSLIDINQRSSSLTSINQIFKNSSQFNGLILNELLLI